MPMSIPTIHLEHWMEPQILTITRQPDETFCEHCGEEIPWHNNSCKLLKQAYKIRQAKCGYCEDRHLVGDQMYDHVLATHKAELLADGIKVKDPL